MIQLPTSLIDFVLDTACAIQQIPAPTFQEAERARFMRERFQQAGLQDVETDHVGNVWGRLPGGDHPPLALSAHMDTVHPLQRPLPLQREPGRITGPAIGDNSLGLAGMLGLIRYLQSQDLTLPGDLIFIANTCEEGMGNLYGMQAVVDRLGNRPLAYMIVEGIGLGNIYHGGLGVERYRIDVDTPGGHSWADFGSPSSIHELAGIITGLAGLTLPKKPRSTMNVGTIEGGTSINTIAPHAACTLDLRSESASILQRMVEDVHQVVKASERAGVNVSLERIGHRPAGSIPVTHPLVRLLKGAVEQLGLTPRIGNASTDANIPLSRGLPAVCFGLTVGGKSHTIHEYIDTHPVEKGMQLLIQVVSGVWEI